MSAERQALLNWIAVNSEALTALLPTGAIMGYLYNHPKITLRHSAWKNVMLASTRAAKTRWLLQAVKEDVDQEAWMLLESMEAVCPELVGSLSLSTLILER